MHPLTPTHFPGFNGFLGTRASFMLDVVFLALFAVLPLLALSIAIVRRRGYLAHKRLQLVLGSVLLLAVLAFEIEMRVFGWHRKRKFRCRSFARSWVARSPISRPNSVCWDG